MVEETLTNTVATVRLTGEEIEYNQVSVEILVLTLSGLQRLVYLLAATEDKLLTANQEFHHSKKHRKKYTLRCQIPKSGSYAIPIALSSSPNSRLSQEPSLIMNNLGLFLQSLQKTDLTQIQEIFPDHKIMAKALQEVQKFLPKNGNRWQFRFSRSNLTEVILTNETYQQIKNWLATTTEWMTVTGKIVSIDFTQQTFVLEYPKSQRKIRCNYRSEVLEEKIIRNKRELVHVTGNCYFDSNNNLIKIQNIEKIETPDLSPIHLQEVSWKSQKLILKQSLTLDPDWDEDTKQLLIVEEPRICLYAYAQTREQLIEEVNEQISFMWQEYVKSDEGELASDAIFLKRELINLFKES